MLNHNYIAAANVTPRQPDAARVKKTGWPCVNRMWVHRVLSGRPDDCLRIVLISTGDRDRADDLVAEAFTRAWMSWAKVRRHPDRQAGWSGLR